MTIEPSEVLQLWWGDGPADDPAAVGPRLGRWFGGGEAFDAMLAERLGTAATKAWAGELDGWAHEGPQGRLALVLLLDQLPRNLRRGTAAAFAQDARARRLSLAMLGLGDHQRLAFTERIFMYLPFEHAEDLPLQELCVALFRQEPARTSGLGMERAVATAVDYAVAHRDIIARFGRFPHRNTALGRATTPEEAEFLTQPGSSF